MAIGHLGKYERLDVLGSGASGVVYLAYDTLLRRQVALKEVRGAGPELDRVLSEARLLDRLRHPSLIAVHAVDEIDGVVVIDMELIRGNNLSEVMRARNRRPLPLDEALTIAVGILDGLAHAHDHRVLHRDIKPANILIGTDGRTVKLTDFGLAELLSSSSLAGGGGTYPYMAPEDFDETAGSDRRSDLWSVGVVVYEMVTGRRPFVVEKTRDPFAWKRVIDNTEPIHVSHLGLGLPSELDVVLTKALSKSKDDRYQDARSFRDALLASAGVAPAAILTESRPNADTRMRIPTPEPQLTTELSPFFVFPDGNATADIDGFLAAAARNWDFSCTALADGRFANFLFKLHADEVANLARSLAANNDLSPDRRLRMFLEYSQPDPDAPEVDPVEEYETIIGVQYCHPDEAEPEAASDVSELNGTVCIELEEITPPRKQILSSRSFGHPVRDYNSLAESITLYMSRAAEKLRSQQSLANVVQVYIRTSPFKLDEPQYSNGMTIPLPSPTDDTRQLVKIALWALKHIYKRDYNYAKAGVSLGDLIPRTSAQFDMFASGQSTSRSTSL